MSLTIRHLVVLYVVSDYLIGSLIAGSGNEISLFVV